MEDGEMMRSFLTAMRYAMEEIKQKESTVTSQYLQMVDKTVLAIQKIQKK
jgi:hypothetical protein